MLRTAGAEGASAEEIQALSAARGFKSDWAPTSINYLKTVRGGGGRGEGRGREKRGKKGRELPW